MFLSKNRLYRMRTNAEIMKGITGHKYRKKAKSRTNKQGISHAWNFVLELSDTSFRTVQQRYWAQINKIKVKRKKPRWRPDNTNVFLQFMAVDLRSDFTFPFHAVAAFDLRMRVITCWSLNTKYSGTSLVIREAKYSTAMSNAYTRS